MYPRCGKGHPKSDHFSYSQMGEVCLVHPLYMDIYIYINGERERVLHIVDVPSGYVKIAIENGYL